MSQSEGSHAKRFITVLIAVIIALVLSPLIFQSIKAANSSGNITGTLATIVNLIPLFYYLAAALIVVADVYTFLKIYKQTFELRTPRGRLEVSIYTIIVATERSVSMIRMISVSGPPSQIVGA